MVKQKENKTMDSQTKAKLKARNSIIIEITWLSIFVAIWVMGLVFAILGMCAFNIEPVTTNPVYIAQKTFGSMIGLGLVDFRIFGSILILLSMLGLIVVLYYYANKYDTIKITKERRTKAMQELFEQNAFSIVKNDEEIKPVTDDASIPEETETTAKIM